jgi:predicted small lipoprotein YifL
VKKTFTIIFIGLFILAGCGQTGPLTLPEKPSEKKPSADPEPISVKTQQTNVKFK